MRGLVLCETTGLVGTFMDTLMDWQDYGVNNYVYSYWNPWDRLVSSYVFARSFMGYNKIWRIINQASIDITEGGIKNILILNAYVI